MIEIKITSSGIACPIFKCAHSGEEIKDASEANVVWLEQTDERGVCGAVSPPRAVLKAWSHEYPPGAQSGASSEGLLDAVGRLFRPPDAEHGI